METTVLDDCQHQLSVNAHPTRGHILKNVLDTFFRRFFTLGYGTESTRTLCTGMYVSLTERLRINQMLSTWYVFNYIL